ncbi:UDP-glucose 4-epimerase GalE [Plantactinospora sp. KBS50]|uniref:UDP-glucose 4-epimerase GalE n=1 Tax=Plantactinospora sp. KBS50 TaxID=2024580 RepID=UPI000BAABA04|nr:UDP-glucose 4-epimerase GalE [Plantactinospora sp. KBS50]ASW54197.1 UDP-glucose 4-epimerase GalE [Plantactinospora sp. KBS50]
MKVLIAGGAGYIGSTVASACLDAGIRPVILDNLSTGRPEFVRDRTWYHGDIADGVLLDRIFTEHPDIEAVLHAAALVAVPESVDQPLRYYRENIGKSIDLVGHLLRNGCRRLLFSSSAAIYAPGPDLTVDEHSPIRPASPYARTKAMLEQILADTAAATGLRAVSLRYFNPIGADPRLRSGLANARPSHALGRLIEAWNTGTEFLITGPDWPTRDGSGIRDYVHVWDLARAHVRALLRFDDILPAGDARTAAPTGGTLAVNLGTGRGTTVRELVAAFRSVVEDPPPVRDAPRRPGDQAGCHTRTDRARDLLGWRPELSLAEGIRDALRWAAVRDARLAGHARPVDVDTDVPAYSIGGLPAGTRVLRPNPA